MNYLDPDLLKTFIAIADTGSITGAASAVGRTQSAISMQVRKIEEIVEGQVLLRTSRGVTLTSRGERLVSHARRLLMAHDEALTDVSGRGLSGAIRLGCPEDYCTRLLPPILRAIAAAHPRVALEVVCATTPPLRRMLDDRLIDLALLSVEAPAESGAATPGGRTRLEGVGRDGMNDGGDVGGNDEANEGENDRMNASKDDALAVPAALGDGPVVRWERFVWVASRDFVRPRDEVLPLALAAPDTIVHRVARAALNAAGQAYRVAYESASKDGLLAIVRAGISVAVMTRSAVPEDLRVLGEADALPLLPRVGVAVVTSSDNADSLLVTRLRELVVATLRAQVPSDSTAPSARKTETGSR